MSTPPVLLLSDKPNHNSRPNSIEQTLGAAFSQGGVYRYKPDFHNGMCAICLDDYHPGDSIVDLPCNHDFHESCMNGWRRNREDCPLCRK